MSEVQPEGTAVKPGADQPRKKILATKVLVACQIGTTGKSTVAANMLYPRLGGRLYSIDSVNQDATQYAADVEVVFADDLYEVRQEMMVATEPVIVDLGSSDFSVFVEQMTGQSIASSFDYVVIVTDTSRRGQEEAITTFQTLRKLGMPAERFRVVLNKARRTRDVRLQYAVLFTYQRAHPEFPVNENCYLPQIDVFQALHETGQNYAQALNDKTDYESKIQEALLADNKHEAIRLGRKNFAKILAASAEEYFERAFAELRIPYQR